MKKVLVTGSNGQLGSELKVLSKTLSEVEFIFTDVAELDITNQIAVTDFFQGANFDFCVNCAAYTAVDKAESDKGLALKINVEAVKNLAIACKEFNIKLIHISTDFVFDGTGYKPYKEDDETNPVSVYGATKLEGEIKALDHAPQAIVIRTSWLYSSFGNNFVKTMIRLGNEKKELGVIFDQIGTPTYAYDLAEVICKFIQADNDCAGIYHFSNEGVASWYDFTHEIFLNKDIKINLRPIETKEYPTPAKRPHYSVLNKSKIKKELSINIRHWKDALNDCLSLI